VTLDALTVATSAGHDNTHHSQHQAVNTGSATTPRRVQLAARQTWDLSMTM